MASTDTTPRFDPAMVAGLDEPVRRYFEHALWPGAQLADIVDLKMSGRIKSKLWMPFTATQITTAQTFMWRAHIARGPLTMMDVVDQFDGETGSTVGRLFGRFPVIDVNNEDTRRSAAGRAAIEAAMFAPSAVLPSKSITWRAISENEVEAAFDMPPERPVIRIRLSPEGQIEQLSMMRWGTVGVKKPQYIPIGCDVHEERRFGNYVIPSRFSVGWWWGSPLHEPFFEAEVVEYAGVESTES